MKMKRNLCPGSFCCCRGCLIVFVFILLRVGMGSVGKLFVGETGPKEIRMEATL
jgi:hypothetical protein